MSYKEILKESTKTNQIGNFISVSVGSGSTIFKAANGWLWGGSSNASSAAFRINLQTGALYASSADITGVINATGGTFTGTLIAATGSFSGAITATSGSFRGTIYAEAGDIEGSLTVSGSLLSDSAGYQTKIYQGKVSFLKSGTEKGFIRTPSGSNGLQISTGEKLYITKSSGSPIVEIEQGGAMRFASDSYIRWGSGRSINATSSSLEIDGDLVPNSNYGVDCGSLSKKWHNVRSQYVIADTCFQSGGNNGISHSGYGVVRRVDHDGDGHVEDVKYVELRLNGGLITRLKE